MLNSSASPLSPDYTWNDFRLLVGHHGRVPCGDEPDYRYYAMRRNKVVSKIPVSDRRARRQAGMKLSSFALMAVFLVPTFLWMFVTGLNLVRFTQVTQITRDIGNMYMQGVDFSTYDAQQTAQRAGKQLWNATRVELYRKQV